MAETVAVKTQIDIGESAKSLKDLKAEFKELQGELSKTVAGSKEYHEVLNKIGNTKDEIQDLNDAINASTGGGKLQSFAKLGSAIAGGFAAAQGAMALFGAESQDLEKALLKVQSAMAISQGLAEIEGLGEAFNNVKKNVLGLWKAIIANPIMAVAAAVAAAAIAFGMWSEKMREQNKESAKLQRQYDDLKKSTDVLNQSYDIEILKLQGVIGKEKELEEIQRKKLQAQIALAKANIEISKAQAKENATELAQANKELGFWEKALLNVAGLETARETGKQKIKEKSIEITEKEAEANLTLQKAEAELIAFENQLQNKKTENNKKAEEDNFKAIDAELEEIRRKKEQQQHEIDMDIQFNAELKAVDDQKAAEDEARRQTELKATQDLEAAKIQASLDRMAAEELAEQQQEERQKLRRQAGLQLAETTLALASELVTTFAAKDEASQRKAFEIDKKIKIAQATIETIKGAQAAFATAAANPITTIFPPYPFIMAGVATAFGVANVAKIARTQFQGGGGGGSLSVPSGGAGTGAPILNNTPQNTTTQLNQDSGTVQGQGNKSVVKTYVVSSDVTAQQEVEKKIINKNKVE